MELGSPASASSATPGGSAGAPMIQPSSPSSSHSQQPHTATFVHPSMSKWFPMRPFAWAPHECTVYIPETVKTVHDVTHLILILGTLGVLFMIVGSVALLLGYRECKSIWMGIRTILTVCFMAPCVFYFIRLIGRYDGNLQAKQLTCQEKQAELKLNYKEAMSEMESLLGKSTESNAALAERNFEEKKRDFVRFLNHAKDRDVFITFDGNPEELRKQFNRFILAWLRIFQECSIDPINKPKLVVSEEELERCRTISDSATLVYERLKGCEVAFISGQRERDQQALKKLIANTNKSKQMFSLFGRHNRSSGLILYLHAWRAYTVHEKGKRQAAKQGQARDLPPVIDEVEAPAIMQKRTCGVTWLRLGEPATQDEVPSPLPDGYPWLFNFRCGSVLMLSPAHAKLVFGFCAGFVCLLVNMFMDPSFTDFLEVFMAQICIVFVLLRFEDLDEVQRLTAEVARLELEAKQAMERKEKMVEFWQKAQQLTDLWRHRTVPRLELVKELHNHLQDGGDQKDFNIVGSLRAMNDGLDLLEQGLGPLEAWQAGGAISDEKKKAFSKELQDLMQRDMAQLLGHLRDVPLALKG